MKTQTLSLICYYFTMEDNLVGIWEEGRRIILEGERATLVVQREKRMQYSVVSYTPKR